MSMEGNLAHRVLVGGGPRGSIFPEKLSSENQERESLPPTQTHKNDIQSCLLTATYPPTEITITTPAPTSPENPPGAPPPTAT